MAGSDEAQARAALATMQARLAQGPHVVFGLDIHANPADIRAAFLALTKVYHPAKFARMSTDLQRQSNEVFLGIKAALEAITKPPPSRSAAAQPQARPARPGTPATGTPITRPGTPPSAAATPITRPGTPPATSAPVGRPGTPPTATSTPFGRSATPPVRPNTPPSATPAPISRPGQPAARVSPAPQPSGGVRFAGGAKSSASVPALDPLATAIELIQKQQWDAAKVMLDTLIAQAPDSRQYRALVCYAAGRRAQLERRPDDARVELNQALMIDPDLALAKTALAELFKRGK